MDVFPLNESHVLVRMEDGMLAALARDTGDVSWETDVADSIGHHVLVEGDTILASGMNETTDGLTETLYALDAESGEERWTALTAVAARKPTGFSRGRKRVRFI